MTTAIASARRTARPHPHFSGWTMLGVGGLALLLSQTAQTPGLAVFVDPMLAEFGWSRSLISAAYTVATLVSAGAVFLAGRLIDRAGHRRVIVATTVAFVAGLLAMGSVTGSATFLLGLTLLRVSGASVLSLAARTLVSQWFVRRRGRAVSLINLGKMVGIALVPPANALLIAAVGWRDAWRVNALVVGLALVPAALLVRGRPAQIGQFPDGRRPEPEDGTSAGAEGGEDAWTLGQARRTRAFWLLLSASAVPALLTNGLSFTQVSLFTAQGLSATVAATVFSVESVVAVPVTLLAGWLADRFGPRPVLAIGQAMLAAAMLWLTVTDSVATAMVYGVLRAVTAGTWVLATEVAWPAFFGNRYLGSILGFTYAVAFVGAALGPLPFGLVYDAFGRYDYALWGLMVLPLVTTWAALAASPPGPPPRRVRGV